MSLTVNFVFCVIMKHPLRMVSHNIFKLSQRKTLKYVNLLQQTVQTNSTHTLFLRATLHLVLRW